MDRDREGGREDEGRERCRENVEGERVRGGRDRQKERVRLKQKE